MNQEMNHSGSRKDNIDLSRTLVATNEANKWRSSMLAWTQTWPCTGTEPAKQSIEERDRC